MNTPSLLVPHIDAIYALVARHRAANLRVFGSMAKGTERPGGDLDLLVDTLPGATLFDLGALQEDLEALLGMPVDLKTPGDLPARIRQHVLAEARPL